MKTHVLIAEHAERISDRAREIVPVRTGYLRSTIEARLEGFMMFSVLAGAEYAGFVEFGTVFRAPQPFLRPAVQQLLPDLVRDVRNGIVEHFRAVLRS